jgi:2-C-methyl-D-erythritol 4-phosphate cytidylyltransferase
LLGHALGRALAVPAVQDVVVVAPESHLAEARAIAERSSRPTAVTVVAGGADRSASVAAGLAALPPPSDPGDVVLVHDAARCLAPPDLFERVITAVEAGHGAVVPGLVPADTVKQVGEGGRVTATPDRSGLRAVQTPQGFRREVLEAAHASGGTATDDAGLVEQAGGEVVVVDGDARALKVTTAHDLAVAALVLAEERAAAR